jgi:hypothetical protein
VSFQGWTFVVVAGLVWAAGHAFACWFWPFARCPKCQGMGSHASPSGKYSRTCRRCKGLGRRERTGLRVWKFIFGR